jgi:hypothetical protein
MTSFQRSVKRKKRYHRRNNQPKQAFQEKEHESPETESLDPSFDLSFIHASALKKISLSAVSRRSELSTERTKMYIAQHSNANGGKPR